MWRFNRMQAVQGEHRDHHQEQTYLDLVCSSEGRRNFNETSEHRSTDNNKSGSLPRRPKIKSRRSRGRPAANATFVELWQMQETT